MSRLYETLRRMEKERRKANPVNIETSRPLDLFNHVIASPVEMESTGAAKIVLTEKSRLVALTDPRGLAAEKFRALVTRLESQRKQRELKSVQITSAVSNEGKTLVFGKPRGHASQTHRLAGSGYRRRLAPSGAGLAVRIRKTRRYRSMVGRTRRSRQNLSLPSSA